MFIHNLDPVIFDFGFLAIRWYSLAYLAGITFGWWYGRKIILLFRSVLPKKNTISPFKKQKTKTIFEAPHAKTEDKRHRKIL